MSEQGNVNEAAEEKNKKALWPCVLNILGQLSWLVGLLEAMDYNWETAFSFVLAGTLLLAVPGFFLALEQQDRRTRKLQFLFLFLFLLILLPLFFVQLMGLYFIMFLPALFFSYALADCNCEGTVDGFFLSLSYVAWTLLLAVVLYSWAMTFTVENPVEDIYFEPETPLANENFTVVVEVRKEGNWTLELEFRLEDGELNTTLLEPVSNTIYSTEFEGFPEGTIFSYRVRVLEEKKEVELSNWREIQII